MSKYKYDYELTELDRAVLVQACINFEEVEEGGRKFPVFDEEAHNSVKSFREASQGVPGFEYECDTIEFYLAHKAAIIAEIKELIYGGVFESRNVIDAVASFNCLKDWANEYNDREDDLMEAIAKAVYSSLTFEQVVDNDNDLVGEVCNALAWGALEECLFNLHNSEIEEIDGGAAASVSK